MGSPAPSGAAHPDPDLVTGWTVYIVRCSDDTLYTGIARDAARRIEEHNAGKGLAASYTRTRRPVVLVYRESAPTRSDALKREYAIKQLTRAQKQALIDDGGPVAPPAAS